MAVPGFMLFSTYFVSILCGFTTYTSITSHWGDTVTCDLLFWFTSSLLFTLCVNIIDLNMKYNDLLKRFEDMAEDFDNQFNESISTSEDVDEPEEDEIPLKKNKIGDMLKDISGKDIDLSEITSRVCQEFTNTFKDALKSQGGETAKAAETLFDSIGDTFKSLNKSDPDASTKNIEDIMTILSGMFTTSPSKDKNE